MSGHRVLEDGSHLFVALLAAVLVGALVLDSRLGWLVFVLVLSVGVVAVVARVLWPPTAREAEGGTCASCGRSIEAGTTYCEDCEAADTAADADAPADSETGYTVEGAYRR